MERKLITIKEVGTALNCSRTTIWRKVKSGALPAPLNVCGMTRWKPEDIEAVLTAAEAAREEPSTPTLRRGRAGIAA
ncbi:helix-turn-helix transcriptional regulator [Pseudotabrizicola alkalilacus]|uniref:DNA-binding protein n=1 Tax=Pseudotabrizicola alkalilacus TaxID=2305252 RepID=A0A411Z859_9RHOB|nr:helix-turn-helix domain-containing protein [Pseudotabrizicola alkalilacus]RGP39241.1 DNA-binding protein [Pseudotabrizicola alkalilacus]